MTTMSRNLLCTFLFTLACILMIITISLKVSSDTWIKFKPYVHNSSDLSSTALNTGTCSRDTRGIVFVKTHKTGSTTLGTMLERYGQNHRLVFALPKQGHIFSNTDLFNRTMVTSIRHGLQLEGKKITGYDILTNHARYNRPEMDAVVVNAQYVTILREPVAQLESAFSYFDMAKTLEIDGSSNALDVFMKTPTVFIQKNFHMSHLALNAQIFDLGLDHAFHNDRFRVNYKIRQLENEFDLVMIMEYFDESLILLKQILCLEFNDILYIKKGVRVKKPRYDITPALHRKMERWNQVDVKLYNHFNNSFWQKVNINRQNFEDELQKFRRLQNDVMNLCVETVTSEDGVTKKKIPNDRTSSEIRFCKSMFMGDGHFTRDLRQRYSDIGLINK